MREGPRVGAAPSRCPAARGSRLLSSGELGLAARGESGVLMVKSDLSGVVRRVNGLTVPRRVVFFSRIPGGPAAVPRRLTHCAPGPTRPRPRSPRNRERDGLLFGACTAR